MPVVIGHDSSWGGHGLCLATQAGPIAVEWVGLKGRKDRIAAFVEFETTGSLATMRAEADLRSAIDGRDGLEMPFEIVEGCPPVYRRGNQAETCYALGEVSALIRRGARRPGWLLPWLCPVMTWRAWYGLKGDRLKVKLGAIQLVKYYGWGALLEPYPDHLHRKRPDTGPKGDVAEAILLAVGAAKRPAFHPTR